MRKVVLGTDALLTTATLATTSLTVASLTGPSVLTTDYYKIDIGSEHPGWAI